MSVGRFRQGRWSTACAAYLLAATLAGCPSATPPPPVDTVNTEAPHWVFGPPRGDRKVAVVFIHGLFGGTTGTWKNARGETFFEYLRDTPRVGDQVDIFAFGFTSNMFAGGSLNIFQAADKLDQILTRQRIWEYETVVLVGHSMGGLISMQAMLNHPEKREKVPLLVLYSSPQEGSQISQIARHVANNGALRQLIPADDNQYLESLDNYWAKIPDNQKPAIVCAYETKDTGPVRIVQRSSATRYCGSERLAIDGADHISIAKPASRDSYAVDILVNALNKYVLEAERGARLEMPDFTVDGDRLVFVLDPLSEGIAKLYNRGAQRLRFFIVPPVNPKLMIDPSTRDAPREIAAGQVMELRFNLLARGRSDPEYAFTLKPSVGPDRAIVVRVPDYAAVEAQQNRVIQAIGTQVEAYLSSPGNVASLNGLPIERQRERIAAIAQQSLLDSSKPLSPATSWVLTADALSRAGMPDIAAIALKKAVETSPESGHSPSVRTLNEVISRQTGTRFLRLPSGEAPSAEAVASFDSELAHIGTENFRAWLRLSNRMLQVPALEQEAMVLQGDVLREQGRLDAAQAAYREAAAIKRAPIASDRLKITRDLQERL